MYETGCGHSGIALWGNPEALIGYGRITRTCPLCMGSLREEAEAL